ncbi:MAG TPA: hypothetical protein VFI32_02815 [Rhodanobacteraceae bacterium]|jgi:hypothetical protein|nr:hypothetical protein [Rhodanobacteraceae bacterium]HEU4855901.1 hypothetical protein [Rhodanobacteraceae bacterium]
MLRKLIAIVIAVAINCAVLAWFHAWSASAVAAAALAPPAAVTLPVINVRPSAAQWRELQRVHAHAGPKQAGAVRIAHPVAPPTRSMGRA